MGETFGGGIARQHEAALGPRLPFVRENHELGRHELAAVIVAHGAGDEQQLAFLDLALEERLPRPGTLERATAAVVAEDRPEYPESLAGGEHPRAHDAADARRLLAHLHLVQGRDRRGVEIPMGGVVQQVPDAPRSEEHTSELQSRLHLVCRLLLEKKKKNKIQTPKTTQAQVT